MGSGARRGGRAGEETRGRRRGLALDIGWNWMDRRLGMGRDGVSDELVVVEGELGRQRGEGEMVETGRGAVLAASAVGVLVISDIHDDGGNDSLYREQ